MTRVPIAIGLIAAGLVSLAAEQKPIDLDRSYERAQNIASEPERSTAIEHTPKIHYSTIATTAVTGGQTTADARRRRVQPDEALAMPMEITDQQIAEWADAHERRRQAEFEAARNAEINASLKAYERQRQWAFEQLRNAEIETAVAAYERQRPWAAAQLRNAEIDRALAAYEGARQAAFWRARNAEIETSLAAYEAARTKALERDRNAEIEAALVAYNAERKRAFAAARNAEIEASVAAYNAQRIFERARNAEIEASIGAYYNARRQPARSVMATDRCLSIAAAAREVRFAASSTRPEAHAAARLDVLAAMVKACPGVRIDIHGHSDATGSPRSNWRLSEARGHWVAAYLAGAGVDARRLRVIGYGATAPLAPNTTAENKARNRRVEFSISIEATPVVRTLAASLH